MVSKNNEYYTGKSKFGVLRVLNDDQVTQLEGFPTHGHRNFEIISYIIDGNLSHADSRGNKETLQRGNIQYMR